MRRPDWNTVRGIEYNKTLDTLLEEIKKLENEHNENVRAYALAKKTVEYPITS
jgi:predicted secreted Zn-dependent protease